MPLQVIGGEARGRRLKSPPGGVRPTAAILRRSLFDILGTRVVDARLLDLYAGAGTLGIEAISRGAASCDFVERDRRCAAVVVENLRLGGFSDRGRVHCAAVMKWLSNRPEPALVDLVLLDPPYGAQELDAVLALLARPGLLADGAMVVVEEHAGRQVASPAGLVEVRRVRHGDSALTLLEPAA
ncbi:MAG: 16S rRNA (guanine(966)-N(2))-methyltransferase RsmD [Candidatus Dormibacteria bacterium]